MIRHQRAIGAASLEVAAHGLTRLAQASPLRILFPTPEPGAALEAAFVNVAGGLAGGDSIESGITLHAGARAQITTPAAEKIYRSLGESSRIGTRISVAEGAVLEFLPQEAILFDGARLTRDGGSNGHSGQERDGAAHVRGILLDCPLHYHPQRRHVSSGSRRRRDKNSLDTIRNDLVRVGIAIGIGVGNHEIRPRRSSFAGTVAFDTDSDTEKPSKLLFNTLRLGVRQSAVRM